MSSTRQGYNRLQIWTHWTVVILVAVQLLVAENMSEVIEAAEEGETVSSATSALGALHYWLGIGIMIAMLGRLGMRVVLGAPAHSGATHPLQEFAASAVHWLLYIVLLTVPISGLVAYYGLADVGDIHALSKPILIVLIGLHALGALYNQFIRRDGTLTRMIRAAD
ncbi:cytochrome b [Devosia salina]|uniref:Cytochrome b/b6 domain-containing protein n=1 Tax=Devosia salina TaxID=2860336 RepID=A0ABX8WJ88_9HYPH|nr:cytochrome b/b6 domain-containing protein [Devosia salina]QYO78702.1 cytochrome b/b6 domain-containing protein [Devosia salina]